jgi:hypothetical protein
MRRIEEVAMRALMKRATLLTAFVACIGGTGSRASAQEESLIVNVPFTFVVEGKSYDPGRYEIRVDDDQKTVEFRGAKHEAGLTHAETEANEPDARLVFDKTGDTYYLSEMWVPGEEGFLIAETRSPHTRRTLEVERSGRAAE